MMTVAVAALLAAAPSPYLIRDLETHPGLVEEDSSRPHDLRVLNGITYFGACTAGGCGLWRSDATEAGTYEVKRVEVDSLAVFQERLFFSGRDYDHRRELWISDGSESGTHLLADLRPRESQFSLGSWPLDLTPAGDRLFFTADDGPHGRELWITDGSKAGTRMVADVAPGELPSAGFVSFTAALGNRIFLFLSEHGFDPKPWISDGTQEGTLRLADVGPVSGSVQCAASTLAANGLVWFVAFEPTSGCEPWVSDGTPSGTRRLMDVVPGAAGSMPSGFLAADGRVFFAVDNGSQRQIWVSDGTEDGTTVFATPDPSRQRPLLAPLGFLDGSLLFSSTADFNFPGFLLRSAGDEIEDIHAITSVGPSTTVGGELYFGGSAENPQFKTLWKSDGTADGTRPVVADDTRLNGPGDLTPFGDGLLFDAFDSKGVELWYSDGTDEGTQQVEDIYVPLGSSNPHGFVVAGDRVLFGTDGGEEQRALWMTDGTAAGTRKLNSPATTPGYPTPIGALGSIVVFSANGALWGTDTESDETYSLSEGPLDFETPLATPNAVFFVVHGVVWRTDGTLAGTVPISATMSYVSELTEALGSLYFVSGGELWRSDGTRQSTVRLHAFDDPLAANRILGELGGRVLVSHCTEPAELWSTDGTPGGTQEIASGGGLCATTPLATLSGRGYFAGVRNFDLHRLWTSDGTRDGTHLVADLGPDAYPTDIVASASSLYFATSSPTVSRSIWTSDGSAAGTRVVLDFYGDSAESVLSPLSVVGDRIYFVLQEVRGQLLRDSLWTSDGTANGSGSIAPLTMRFFGSGWDAALLGTRYYYGGFEETTGWEPWAVDLSPSFPCRGDCNGDGALDAAELEDEITRALEGAPDDCDIVGGALVRVDTLVSAVKARMAGSCGS
jgi:ELWxxDGT repeat protein